MLRLTKRDKKWLIIIAFILVVTFILREYLQEIKLVLGGLFVLLFPFLLVFYLMRLFSGWGMTGIFSRYGSGSKWVKSQKATSNQRITAWVNFLTLLVPFAVICAIIGPILYVLFFRKW